MIVVGSWFFLGTSLQFTAKTYFHHRWDAKVPFEILELLGWAWPILGPATSMTLYDCRGQKAKVEKTMIYLNMGYCTFGIPPPCFLPYPHVLLRMYRMASNLLQGNEEQEDGWILESCVQCHRNTIDDCWQPYRNDLGIHLPTRTSCWLLVISAILLGLFFFWAKGNDVHNAKFQLHDMARHVENLLWIQ